jgi:RNA polymerase sigma-70 factor, ECF subfamily
VNAQTEASTADEAPAETFDFETAFRLHYRRIARLILRLIQDPSRAEELAVDVFWKLWRHPSAQGPQCAGWLYRTASRAAIDEIRTRRRREKYERWFGIAPSHPRPAGDDPEQSREAAEARTHIRTVLAALRSQDAQLVALRSEGLSYDELADALNLNPSSIGTMLRRAQDTFRKEYIRRYGDA